MRGVKRKEGIKKDQHFWLKQLADDGSIYQEGEA